MKTKSAKDLAFEKERQQLRKQKREAEELAAAKDIIIKELNNRISELEAINSQKDEWIERLLTYTELSKEDLQTAIEKDKAMANAAKSLEAIMGFSQRFGF